MGEYFVKRPLKRPPVHPGEILREDVLPTLGLSVSEAARRLGISRQQLHRVLAWRGFRQRSNLLLMLCEPTSFIQLVRGWHEFSCIGKTKIIN